MSALIWVQTVCKGYQQATKVTSRPSGLFQKKIPGRGRRQAIYFSMGGWCGKFSNFMGHWCSTKSNYMGGWFFTKSN